MRRLFLGKTSWMSEGVVLMKINHFRDMYIAELQELVSADIAGSVFRRYT